MNVAATSDPCPICGSAPRARRTVSRAGNVALCKACGSWYRIPRPDAATLAKIYDRDYYDAWGLHVDEEIARVTKMATFAPVLDEITARISPPLPVPVRILDVGAANGILLRLAAARGWEPWAVELNPFAVEHLVADFGRDHVHQGDLTDCPFPDHSMDVVTMLDLIEHVLDVAAVLKKTAALLRPGGILCISTPRIDSFSRMFTRADWPHFKIEHIQYFSRRSLHHALARAGFCDIRIHGHRKLLSLDYLHHQLQTFRHSIGSPLVAALHRVLPASWRKRPIGFRFGEMLAVARAPA